MKRVVSAIWSAVVTLLLVAIATPAAAQQRPGAAKPPAKPAAPAAGNAAAQKLAFVNTRQVLQQTPGYAAAESTFTREMATYRTEVTKLQTTLDSAAQDFDQQSVVLSPTQRAAKRKELEGQQQKLEARMQELQQKADTRQRELLDPINKRVSTIIEGIRAEGNYAFIFDVSAPGSVIITADRALDLTPRVIERLKSGS
jgi:Skp family chaperone for outer membrane proteins